MAQGFKIRMTKKRKEVLHKVMELILQGDKDIDAHLEMLVSIGIPKSIAPFWYLNMARKEFREEIRQLKAERGYI